MHHFNILEYSLSGPPLNSECRLHQFQAAVKQARLTTDIQPEKTWHAQPLNPFGGCSYIAITTGFITCFTSRRHICCRVLSLKGVPCWVLAGFISFLHSRWRSHGMLHGTSASPSLIQSLQTDDLWNVLLYAGGCNSKLPPLLLCQTSKFILHLLHGKRAFWHDDADQHI